MESKFPWALAAVVLLVCSSAKSLGKSFHVGPRQTVQAISEVPWESLQAGDEVLIDWRPEPYKEKWVICCQGTEKSPVVIRGVPGPKDQLPIIDGNGARTRKQLDYWGDVRGVIKIGGSRVPKGALSDYVIIENLDIRSARPPYSFIDSKGQTKNYNAMAAALYVERAHHLAIRNCILRDSANGLFISSGDETASEDVLVERCSIYDNGMEKSGFQHNVYTEGIGITYQFNHLGPLRTNCLGNNLKDRSAGLVVRYNWIEGGDKQLDLVDGEDSSLVRNHPAYRKTFVYGNVFITTPQSRHNQLVHYGGDGRLGNYYRKGTLYFYNNTVVSSRKDPMNVFWLSTNEENCDCRNNIFYSAGNAKFSPLSDKGVIRLSHNFVPENWTISEKNGRGTVQDDGTFIKQRDPGFLDLARQDFRISGVSKCRDHGINPAKQCLPANVPTSEYIKHQQSRRRSQDQHIDIGAYEFEN